VIGCDPVHDAGHNYSNPPVNVRAASFRVPAWMGVESTSPSAVAAQEPSACWATSPTLLPLEKTCQMAVPGTRRSMVPACITAITLYHLAAII
jgi:hypothetical protein